MDMDNLHMDNLHMDNNLWMGGASSMPLWQVSQSMSHLSAVLLYCPKLQLQ
jgi:hypothetical protein